MMNSRLLKTVPRTVSEREARLAHNNNRYDHKLINIFLLISIIFYVSVIHFLFNISQLHKKENVTKC